MTPVTLGRDVWGNPPTCADVLAEARDELAALKASGAPGWVYIQRTGDTMTLHYVEMKPSMSHAKTAKGSYIPGVQYMKRVSDL